MKSGKAATAAAAFFLDRSDFPVRGPSFPAQNSFPHLDRFRGRVRIRLDSHLPTGKHHLAVERQALTATGDDDRQWGALGARRILRSKLRAELLILDRDVADRNENVA